ncbi:MAG: hypothetical protein IEMM0002_0405 [bacterium]|nr:MAG: hypothetical protein IEMM0002_0405 [bacterium]
MLIRITTFVTAAFLAAVLTAGCDTPSSAPDPIMDGNGGSGGGGGGNTGGGGTVGGTCTSGSSSGTDAGSATISGKVEYEDKPFNKNGFTGAISNMPVRRAIVQAVDASGAILVETETDASGNYTVGFAYTSGAVCVRALTDGASPYAATVKDFRDDSIYAVISGDLAASLPGTLSNQNLLADKDDVGQAFNIFDQMITTQINLQTFSSASLNQIDAYWHDGATDGTYYWPQSGVPSIFLLGTTSDSDTYDDTVILHELGHYAAASYSQDDSPGGPHALTGQYDLRLTWSEGWATFFGQLMRDIAGQSSPEVYVDTSSGGITSFFFEIETPFPDGKGADNEVAVAAVLWDIYDLQNPPNAAYNDSDSLSLGYGEIWDIVDNRLPTFDVVTFEAFWDSWEANVQSGQLAPPLTDRDIRYSADVYEDNDDSTINARTVTAGISENHTFFPAGDKDYVKINAANGLTYTFVTDNLGDGADTLLTLYDSNGTTQLDQNDDDSSLDCTTGSAPSTIPCLASKITWTANATKTVYLLVESYNQTSPIVSNYGYYTLSISAQ